MSIRDIFRIFPIVACAAAVLIACGPDMSSEDNGAAFPELQRFYDLKPGDVVELSFTADAPWTISVPDSSLNDFWIQDGTFELDSKSGGASQEPVTINIAVSSSESFSDRYCEVIMTMGTRSAVIAELSCPGRDRNLTLYTCNVEEDAFLFDEEGNYAYSDAEASEVSLIWSGSDFRLPVRVTANYNWTVEFPSWARADLADTRTGTTEFNIYAIPSEYPVDPAEGMIKFKAGEDVVKEYRITIPGCRDIYSCSLDLGLTELEFNYIGQYKVPTGYLDAPATGKITGIDGASVVVAEIDENGMYTGNEADWVEVEVSAYDDSEGVEVLQTRTVSINVLKNEGESRYATLLLLPPVEGERSELYTADMSAINEEYMQYAFPICQTAVPDDYLTPQSDAATMAGVGALFEKAEEDWLLSAFGSTDYAYKLTYAQSWSRDESFMYLTTSFASYDVYDQDNNIIPADSLANHWLSFTALDGNMVGVVDMNSDRILTETAEGFIVFRDANDNALAVIWCIFDPAFSVGGGGNTTVAFIGEYAQYAEMCGASLVEVVEGDALYNQFKEYQAPIYHLTYTQENMPMLISIPSTAVLYSANPFIYRSNFEVNDLDYDQEAGKFSFIDGGVQIYMTMPEAKTYQRGWLIFYDSSNEVVLVLVCTFDLTGAVQ